MLSSFACCAQVIALGVWVLVWCSVLSHLAVLGAADVILIVLKAARGFLAWTFASAGSSAGEKWLDGYVMELVLSMVALLQCKGSLAGKVSSSTRHILTGEHLPVPHDLGLFQSSCKDGTLRALPRVHLPDAFPDATWPSLVQGDLWIWTFAADVQVRDEVHALSALHAVPTNLQGSCSWASQLVAQ